MWQRPSLIGVGACNVNERTVTDLVGVGATDAERVFLDRQQRAGPARTDAARGRRALRAAFFFVPEAGRDGVTMPLLSD